MKTNIIFLLFLAALVYLATGVESRALIEMGFHLNYVSAIQAGCALLVVIVFMGLALIGNIIIRPASAAKEVLERALINAEGGQEIEDHIFWDLLGSYESRIFGLCIYRDKSDKFIDELTDRYIAAKLEHKMPLLKSLEKHIKEPKKINDCG